MLGQGPLYHIRSARTLVLAVAGALSLLAIAGGRTAWATPSQNPTNQTLPFMFTGTVQLQGRPLPADNSWVTQLNVTIYYAGTNTVYKSVDLATTDTGTFIVTEVDKSTWDIRVKASHTLANRKNGVTIVGNTQVFDFGTLLEGDADGNNRVSILDFSILATAYGKSAGDSGFDARADFNNNGRVEILDFSLLATNYLMQGDITVTGISPAAQDLYTDRATEPRDAGP